MIINNFVEFAEFATTFKLCNTDTFFRYYNEYIKICSCKPTYKSMLYGKTQKRYIEYVASNKHYIKEKIESINDPILILKNDNQIIFDSSIN